MVQPNRMFFALTPDAETRAALANAGRLIVSMIPHGGRLVREDKLHLTLMFLGEAVPADDEKAALEAAQTVGVSPFTLQIDCAGSFSSSPSVWWLGQLQPSEELLNLRKQLQSEISGRKVSYDRQRFAPHVSIVRNAGSRLPSTVLKPILWRCESFSLLRSRIGKPSDSYEELGTWRLQNARSDTAGQIALF